MIRAVYALSALLVLLGAGFILVGLPDIHFEQGWTEVISGSIAASAGCVIFVMGAILTRLDGLTAALRVAPQVVPARVAAGDVEDGQPAAVTSDAAAERDEAVDDQRPEILEPVLSAGVVHAAVAEEPRVLEPMPVVEARSEPVEDAVGPPPIPPPDEPDPLAKLPGAKRPNFLASFLSRRAAQRDEEISRLFAQRPDGAGEVPVGRDHGEISGLDLPPMEPDGLRPTYGDDVAEAEESQPPEPVGAGEPEEHVAEAEPHDAPAPHGDPAQERAVSDDAPAPDEEPSPAPADHPLRPTVVGRYSAGSASYVMYSNGMIEVETEGGVHQFASMADLKAFIEQQEAARV